MMRSRIARTSTGSAYVFWVCLPRPKYLRGVDIVKDSTREDASLGHASWG